VAIPFVSIQKRTHRGGAGREKKSKFDIPRRSCGLQFFHSQKDYSFNRYVDPNCLSSP
jgi:hypothetical protein